MTLATQITYSIHENIINVTKKRKKQWVHNYKLKCVHPHDRLFFEYAVLHN